MLTYHFILRAFRQFLLYIDLLVWVVLEVIGGVSIIIMIAILFDLPDKNNLFCTSIVSRSVSPDGRTHGVVLDCWPQSSFGYQGIVQELIVSVVRPDDENKLVSTVESCSNSESTILSIEKDDLRERPLLRWVTSDMLEISLTDNSYANLFKTNYDGVKVQVVFERTEYQKQQRRNKTSGEPDDFNSQHPEDSWRCFY
jgi:protease II